MHAPSWLGDVVGHRPSVAGRRPSRLWDATRCRPPPVVGHHPSPATAWGRYLSLAAARHGLGTPPITGHRPSAAACHGLWTPARRILQQIHVNPPADRCRHVSRGPPFSSFVSLSFLLSVTLVLSQLHFMR
ncbi:hypothetical protein GUJ93_ZPchr0014g47545 [Zizania palustris]|uniref:Uncharacterized protein n=1 Tax=Zizania palustris TaxID=103762 RepID=A0A8J5TKM7_ZIZPA|nr:hypothetical protein GUJ93_ZPchr0014g47545 [Zizania palustris]